MIDVDGTSCLEIAAQLDAFAREKVPLLLAALPGPVRDTLQRYGVGDDDSAAVARRGGGGSGAAAAAPAAAAEAAAAGTAAAVAVGNGGGDSSAEEDAAAGGEAAPLAPAAFDLRQLAALRATRFLTVAAAIKALDEAAAAGGAAV